MIQSHTYTVRSYEQTFSAQAPPEIAGTTATRWQVVRDDDRTVTSGCLTREDAEQNALSREAGDLLVSVMFTDGTSRTVYARTLPDVIGLDHYGHVVVKSDEVDFTYPLTDCCLASAKGMEGGVGCRSCYAYISDELCMTDPTLAASVVLHTTTPER